jgi:hypothetical protein
MGIPCELKPDYNYRNLRSCQASGKKIGERLGFAPKVTVEETVRELAGRIRDGSFHDVSDPAYHNIRWLDLLEETRTKLGYAQSVLNLNPAQLKEVRAAASKPRSTVTCE